MRFALPGYLWLLALLPVLALVFALMFRRRRKALEAFGDLHLMKRLTASASTEKDAAKAKRL